MPAKPLLESGGQVRLERVIQTLIAEGPNTAVIPLLRAPVVFTLLPVWQMAGSGKEELAAFMSVIQEQLDLAEIYAGVEPGAVYCLRALVCYTAQHYVAFCYNDTLGKWLLYDDEFVEIGGEW